MFRIKDFTLMDVVYVSGKKLGFIKDVLLDFNSGIVIGFSVSSYNLLVKSVTVLKEDILAFNELMIVRNTCKVSYLNFKEYKNMEVIDRCGNLVGMLEDIIFDENFKIKGVLISGGIIRKLFEGKRVALINDIIVGEDNILLVKELNKFNFVSIPHSLTGVNYYDEEV
jgi:uncharacterized protein YrrD